MIDVLDLSASPSVRCVACRRDTKDIVYVGKLRCCGRRIYVGRCCKALVLEMFRTVGHYARKFARLHAVVCKERG